MSKSASATAAAPGSRRSRKRERTRREILEAALTLFGRQGFEAVTLDQICEAADVARGTFFLHYPSKGALLRELDRQLAEEWARDLREPRGSARAEYRTLAQRVCRDWPQRPGLRADLVAAVLREALQTPRDAEPTSAPGPAPGLRDCIEEIVRRGQARGELRQGVTPRRAALVFLASAAALLEHEGVAGEDAATSRPLHDALLQALLHGLAEGKPRLKWRPAGSTGASDAFRGPSS